MFTNAADRDQLMFLFELYRDEQHVFHGYDEEEEKTVFGYYNTGKINPKEPDLRIYYGDQDRSTETEYLAMWCKISHTGRKYLIGNRDGTCYIGLINLNRLSESDPYITIYLVMKTVKKECTLN